jgi:hypothetical protein
MQDAEGPLPVRPLRTVHPGGCRFHQPHQHLIGAMGAERVGRREGAGPPVRSPWRLSPWLPTRCHLLTTENDTLRRQGSCESMGVPDEIAVTVPVSA